MPNAILLSRIEELHDLRNAESIVEALLDLKREAFQAENAELIEQARLARNAVGAAETALRAIAAEEYAKTGEAKPCAGIIVKNFAVLRYDEKRALEWAKETNMAIIPVSLDKKAFEKIAKATPLPFVEYLTTPVITVASDLRAALNPSATGAEA